MWKFETICVALGFLASTLSWADCKDGYTYIRENKSADLEKLLIDFPKCANSCNPLASIGLLSEAASKGNVNAIKILLKYGASPNKVCENISPLQLAARDQSNVEPVALLLDAGAKIDYIDWANAALDQAVAARHYDIAKYLIGRGANVNINPRCCQSGDTPLHTAARKNFPEFIELLVKEGADINNQNSMKDTPFIDAAAHGSIASMDMLLALGADPNIRGLEDALAIHEAVRHNQAESIRYLVSKGQSVESFSSRNGTPLLFAAEIGALESFDALIALNANIRAEKADGSSVVDLAMAEIVRYILDRKLLSVNYVGTKGSTFLHQNCTAVGDKTQTEYLLAKGANIQIRDQESNLPIHLAALYYRFDTVGVLLAAGAKLSDRNNKGEQPIHLAAGSLYCYESCLEFYKNMGADFSSLTLSGASALHYAAMTAESKVIRALTHHGAKVNLRDHAGNTPLHSIFINTKFKPSTSLFEGAYAATLALLDAGADIDSQNDNGDTAFHLMMSSKISDQGSSLALIGLKKADLNLRNKKGLTVLGAAEAAQVRTDLIQAIKEAGGIK